MTEKLPRYGQSSGHPQYPVHPAYVAPGSGQPYWIMPPKKNRAGLWILGFAGAFLVCTFVPFLGFVLINVFASDDARADVHIVDCGTQQIGGLRTGMARFTVRNSTSHPRKYQVEVTFDSPSSTPRYDHKGMVLTVVASRIVTAEVDGSSPVGTDMTCEISDAFWVSVR